MLKKIPRNELSRRVLICGGAGAALWLLAREQELKTCPWSVGYWTPYGKPPVPVSDIPWKGLTHVVEWAALAQPNGKVDLETYRIADNAPALIETAHNSGVKVLLGVTQSFWEGRTTHLRQAAAFNLSSLVAHLMEAVERYGFDGMDIDWEPFDPALDGPALAALINALRDALGSRILTACAIVTDSQFWGSVHDRLDRVSVMSYDMSGHWDPYVWHNAALYSADSRVWSTDLAVRRFTSKGVPARKLAIGIPLFGWEWSGENISGPGQSWKAPPKRRQIAYHNFSSRITPETYRWDSSAQVPFLSENSGSPAFLSYDNEQSIEAKIRFAIEKELGGWIIWALDQDYFPNNAEKHPLMKPIQAALSSAAGPCSSIGIQGKLNK